MNTPVLRLFIICLACFVMGACRTSRVVESTVSSSIQRVGLRQFDTHLRLNDTLLILRYAVDSGGATWLPKSKIIRTINTQQRSTDIDSCQLLSNNVSIKSERVERLPFQDNGVLYRVFLTVFLLGALCFLIKRL